MQKEVSFEFLACLEDYRRKYITHKTFRALKKHVLANRRRYNRACLSLEYWSHQTMKKCFNCLKYRQYQLGSHGIDYSKGIYLILLAASCFLSEKAFRSCGYRLDKLLSLFKQVRYRLGIIVNCIELCAKS